LAEDVREPRAERVLRGYLLHLVNMDRAETCAHLEQRLVAIEHEHANIRTAYARVTQQVCRYKFVSSPMIQDEPA